MKKRKERNSFTYNKTIFAVVYPFNYSYRDIFSLTSRELLQYLIKEKKKAKTNNDAEIEKNRQMIEELDDRSTSLSKRRKIYYELTKFMEQKQFGNHEDGEAVKDRHKRYIANAEKMDSPPTAIIKILKGLPDLPDMQPVPGELYIEKSKSGLPKYLTKVGDISGVKMVSIGGLVIDPPTLTFAKFKLQSEVDKEKAASEVDKEKAATEGDKEKAVTEVDKEKAATKIRTFAKHHLQRKFVENNMVFDKYIIEQPWFIAPVGKVSFELIQNLIEKIKGLNDGKTYNINLSYCTIIQFSKPGSVPTSKAKFKSSTKINVNLEGTSIFYTKELFDQFSTLFASNINNIRLRGMNFLFSFQPLITKGNSIIVVSNMGDGIYPSNFPIGSFIWRFATMRCQNINDSGGPAILKKIHKDILTFWDEHVGIIRKQIKYGDENLAGKKEYEEWLFSFHRFEGGDGYEWQTLCSLKYGKVTKFFDKYIKKFYLKMKGFMSFKLLKSLMKNENASIDMSDLIIDPSINPYFDYQNDIADFLKTNNNKLYISKFNSIVELKELNQGKKSKIIVLKREIPKLVDEQSTVSQGADPCGICNYSLPNNNDNDNEVIEMFNSYHREPLEKCYVTRNTLISEIMSKQIRDVNTINDLGYYFNGN